MKIYFNKTGLWLLASYFTLFIAAGCKNNGNDNSSTDSVKTSDTIVSDDKDTVPKDTIDLETYLGLMESMIDDLKQIYINKPEDTLKYEWLDEKWSMLDNYEVQSFDKDEMKHSDKVRFLKFLVDYDSETKRIANEAKAAGVAEFCNLDKYGEEDSEWDEFMQSCQRQLWLETH